MAAYEELGNFAILNVLEIVEGRERRRQRQRGTHFKS